MAARKFCQKAVKAVSAEPNAFLNGFRRICVITNNKQRKRSVGSILWVAYHIFEFRAEKLHAALVCVRFS